jgi:hypothetical protein
MLKAQNVSFESMPIEEYKRAIIGCYVEYLTQYL